MMFLDSVSPLQRKSLCWPTWFTAVAVFAMSAVAFSQVPTDLTGARFAPNCGAANATQIFADGFLASGQAGISDMQIVSDPDVVLIGNQWWLIFASNPGPTRGIEPVAAYLPPGVSLSYTGVYPQDPNGWHLIGANATDTGLGVAIDGTPSPAGWDTIAAETPSIDVGPDGTVSVYYAGHNLGATNFEIGLMNNVVNGVAASGDPVPAMVAQQPWEFADGLGAILEQSVRWHPELNKFLMYYTAGAWWDQPPTNDIAYAESTDGITWTNRQHLGFPKSYYNQDFLYNPQRNRYEMVVANDPTGVGGGNGRDLVWLDSATPGTQFSDWKNQVTLLDHTSPGTPTWRDQGLLSPAIKYGNLPGEENRIYVFFHAYGSADPLSIARFYCDAVVTAPEYTVTSGAPFLNLAPGASSTMPVTINPINGFTGTVNFTVSGAPAGVTTSLQPSSSATGTTLSVAVGSTTPQGRYPITVTGTSGTLIRATTFTLNVSGLSQTITIQPFPAPAGGITYAPGLQYQVVASASSGLPVTLSVGGNGTLSGNTLSVTGGGTIVVAANQAGNSVYSPAPQATAELLINPEVQTVNVATIPPQAVGGTLDLNPFISTSSGLTGYTFVGISPSVCTNNGSVLTFVAAGQCVVIVIQFGNVDYAPAGVAAYITVNPGTPTITWAPAGPITYGTPLGAAQLNAMASTPGTFVYSPPAGTVLAAGTQTLGAVFTPADTTDYTNATAQVNLVVKPANTPLTFATIPQHTYGDAPFTVSASSVSTGAITYSVASGPASVVATTGVVTLTGAGPVTLTASQVPSGNYAANVGSAQLQILQQATTTALSLSSNSITPLQQVTLTATVSPKISGSVTPTGTVTFFDGSTSPATKLGSAVALASAQAQLPNISLLSGSHTLYAVYSSDTNYLASSSPSTTANLTVAAEDFILGPSGSGTLSEAPGTTAAATFSIAPVYDMYPGPVTFAVGGLPTGATYTLTPTTVAFNAGPQSLTLSVTAPAAVAQRRTGRELTWSVALLLPLFMLGRGRRKLLPMLGLILVLSAGALSMSGCGTSVNGYFGQAAVNYSVTVTGTSGSKTHVATLTLQVQ